MIEGASIRLRAWRDSDLPALTTLRNDVASQAQLLARVCGSSLEQVREWLQGRTGQADRMLFIIADRQDDDALGFVQITDLDTVDRRANLGICLFSHARGRGLGGQAIALAAGHLCAHWNLRKLSLQVRTDNTAALCCYEKAGFTRCGLLKQHVFIEGDWHDVILMERFLVRTD